MINQIELLSTLNIKQSTSLFSKERLEGYESTKEHCKNFTLISLIAGRLGILEVILRNHIHKTMLEDNSKWLECLPSELNLKTSPKHTKYHELISHQSLGFWLRVVEHYKIHNRLFDREFLDSLNFKRYFSGNKNRFKSKPLRDYQKVSIFLNLFRNLRNRAFHFENLYKLDKQGRPRLSAFVGSGKEMLVICIETDKIELFLDDFISYFIKRVLEGGRKGSPANR